jgi:hypothetical protein
MVRYIALNRSFDSVRRLNIIKLQLFGSWILLSSSGKKEGQKNLFIGLRG